MRISAYVRNGDGQHEANVSTNGTTQGVPVSTKENGFGFAINGGEFLMLALATCYCNDLYREAQRLGITLTRVEVEAHAEFAGIGLAARDIRYRAQVESPASPEQIGELIRQTDAVAEIHNTIRAGVPVTLEKT